MSRKMKESNIEWLGKIPNEWNIIPLKYATININEKNNPIKMTNVLSLTNTLGVVPYEEKGNQGNVSKEDLTQYKLAYKNTVIINSMNLKIGSVGLSNYNGCVSPVYYVLKNTEKTDIRFINYIFQSNFQKYLAKYGKGIMEIREKIPMYDVMHSYIPLPCIEEQEKIANYLDRKVEKIDQVIEDIKNVIELIEEYKNEYLQSKFDKLSKESKKIKLKYLGKLQNGISAGAEKFGHGKGTFINYGDVYNYDVIPNEPKGIMELNEKEIETYSLKRGDILFTRTSETIDEVGMSAVCIKDYPNSAFSGFVIRFRPSNSKNMLPDFYKYYFKLKKHRDYFAREMNLVTRASLSQSLLGNIETPVPSIEIQKILVDEINEKLNSLSNVIEYRKQIIEKLEEYKKSLIYEVVTGKVEVQ